MSTGWYETAPAGTSSAFDDLPPDWRCRSGEELESWRTEEEIRRARRASRALTPAEREGEQ